MNVMLWVILIAFREEEEECVAKVQKLESSAKKYFGCAEKTIIIKMVAVQALKTGHRFFYYNSHPV